MRSLSEFEGGHDVLRVRGQRGNLFLAIYSEKMITESVIKAAEQVYEFYPYQRTLTYNRFLWLKSYARDRPSP